MRAKFQVMSVNEDKDADGNVQSIRLRLAAVGGDSVAHGYPEDGADEDSTFSRWTPCANLEMVIQNPALFDKFTVGQKLYSDFTEVAA
jgi:hypothetical protein